MAQAAIVIRPRAGVESSFRRGEASGKLSPAAAQDGRSKAVEESAEFILPSGAALVIFQSDRLRRPTARLEEWIVNDGLLGWLSEGDKRNIYIYRAGRAVEKLPDINGLAGEGLVDGFVLELIDIRAGL